MNKLMNKTQLKSFENRLKYVNDKTNLSEFVYDMILHSHNKVCTESVIKETGSITLNQFSKYYKLYKYLYCHTIKHGKKTVQAAKTTIHVIKMTIRGKEPEKASFLPSCALFSWLAEEFSSGSRR